MVSSKPEVHGTANQDVEASSDDENQPPTKQQKLIKAGLLLALVLVIIYVILDYTVSADCFAMRIQTVQAFAGG